MLYIITHKEFEKVESDDFYKSLLVGAEHNTCLHCDTKDNEGNNISEKNTSFCELTGLYWLWKNTCDDMIGLCHYRRYFAYGFFDRKKKIIKGEDVGRYLSQHDIILPQKVWFNGKTAKKFYKKYHNVDDWEKMSKVLLDLYPDYESDIRWFEKEKSGYCYNMFITTRNLFDQYCSWLFSILFELEKKLITDTYGIYNRRVYGFLAERMINIWVHHNKLNVKELPIYNSELLSMLYNKSKNFMLRKIRKERKY